MSLPSNLSIEGAFLREISTFDRVDRSTEVMEDRELTYYVNDYWTVRQRQGNRLHEISYRACFKPQLPEFFINRLTSPGDTVYDPFMGRGTTPVQAALMQRKPVGNDVNPLSIMLTRPRLEPPSVQQVADRLNQVPWTETVEIDPQFLVFYHPKTLAHITVLRNWLSNREKSGDMDSVDEWIRMVAINRLTGHSPGFFSVYTLPPNQAASMASQKKINERYDQSPPERNVENIILKKTRSLLSHHPAASLHKPLLGSKPAANTDYIASNSIDLIVTSPPFLDIVQYKYDNWLRLWFAGIDADSVSIANFRDPDDWCRFVRECFVEFARVVRPSGHIAFEVGDVRKGSIRLEWYVAKAVVGLPFETLGVLVNDQMFTKTSNCWGVTNNIGGTNTNRIVVLRRKEN